MRAGDREGCVKGPERKRAGDKEEWVRGQGTQGMNRRTGYREDWVIGQGTGRAKLEGRGQGGLGERERTELEGRGQGGLS